MTELEKAARMALEALDSLLDVAMVPMTCEGLCSAESVDKWNDFSFRRDALRTALTQALATPELVPVLQQATLSDYELPGMWSTSDLIGGETDTQPATTERKGPLSKDQIREVFLAHGFTVKDGQTDLKPYVYDAAYALIALVQTVTERKGEPVWSDMGAWLWVKLADYCRRKGLNPHHENDLFNLAGELRAMLAHTSPQETERKGEPVKSMVIQCPMCADFDPDAACHFCSLLSVRDVEEWRNAVAIAKPVPNTGMVPVKARTILAVDRLITNAVAAQAQPAVTSPQVPEDTELLDFMEERRVSLIPEHEGPWAARQYDDDPQFAADAEGATPRDALRALFDAARKGE